MKYINSFYWSALALSMAGISHNASAAPFEECPSEAFLSQYINGATHYKAVDLSTGSVKTLQSIDGLGSNSINALAFNEADRYVYGFNMSTRELVKFDGQFKATTLAFTNPPENTFYVGDIKDNVYYFYRKNVGLFYTHLDPERSDYLTIQKVEGADQYMNIADFAFHPLDSKLYAVSGSNGDIYQIDPISGKAKVVANSGFSANRSAFGAAYFDVNGFLYFVLNSDGSVYRSDLTDPDNISGKTIYFAKASPTSSNDGARCANAPIISTNTDFGDAPDSYGTTLANNGARHLINYYNYFLGSSIDAEPDAYVYPLSDQGESISDEDGVVFKTGLVSGLDTQIEVTVGGGAAGHLSAWFDWNQDGDFNDAGEQSITDLKLLPGTHNLLVRVPADAAEGTTWSRFRLSDGQALNSDGGAVYGEVEDYQVEVTAGNTSYLYYPGKDDFVTLAYEDQWPQQGDYDFNDVVMGYNVSQVIQGDKVTRIDIKGQLVAYGAGYANGFAVHLEGVDRNLVDENLIKLSHNGVVLQTATPLESGQSEAVVIISDNLKNHFSATCGSGFYRTEAACRSNEVFTFEISIPLVSPLDFDDVPDMPLNPFIFASENRARNSFFGGVMPGRSLEVHLADQPLTDAADLALMGIEDDRSSLPLVTYRTDKNMPWAIEIGGEWKPALESIDMTQAYPGFVEFVTSGGEKNTLWFNNPIINNTYQ
ncbi:LruC domain-containing protein [Alkalimarinus sediminis]|uniref:LruC domain-containing protein n=1 Tax=Alkalimarinus sediminis TaxID=1632866 RepID=A0A9E8KJ09_9ALTE|nr:LruC domain-containing protein [Alkalimarinus sediminis]UZW74496.1 LruC domain-containing protein [Alkalimarinus sediminis]